MLEVLEKSIGSRMMALMCLHIGEGHTVMKHHCWGKLMLTERFKSGILTFLKSFLGAQHRL